MRNNWIVWSCFTLFFLGQGLMVGLSNQKLDVLLARKWWNSWEATRKEADSVHCGWKNFGFRWMLDVFFTCEEVFLVFLRLLSPAATSATEAVWTSHTSSTWSIRHSSWGMDQKWGFFGKPSGVKRDTWKPPSKMDGEIINFNLQMVYFPLLCLITRGYVCPITTVPWRSSCRLWKRMTFLGFLGTKHGNA